MPDIKKAVIIRAMSQIIGTALVPRGLYRKVKEDCNEYFGSDEEVELGIDVETVYVL